MKCSGARWLIGCCVFGVVAGVFVMAGCTPTSGGAGDDDSVVDQNDNAGNGNEAPANANDDYGPLNTHQMPPRAIARCWDAVCCAIGVAIHLV